MVPEMLVWVPNHGLSKLASSLLTLRSNQLPSSQRVCFSKPLASTDIAGESNVSVVGQSRPIMMSCRVPASALTWAGMPINWPWISDWNGRVIPALSLAWSILKLASLPHSTNALSIARDSSARSSHSLSLVPLVVTASSARSRWPRE